MSFSEAACANTGSVATLLACYLDLLWELLSTSAFPSINTKTVQLVAILSCLRAMPCSVPLSRYMCVRASVWVCMRVCA